MDNTNQGRENIPLDDFDRGNNQDNNWDEYDEESSFGDFRNDEYRNYEKEFDWNRYSDETLDDREKERILLKNFLQDREVFSKFDNETDEVTKDIIKNIKDPNLKRNIMNEIALRESSMKGKVKRIGNDELKEIIIGSIDKTKKEDSLFEFSWDKEIISNNKDKFLWEQKANNLNQAFRFDDIFIDISNESVHNFIEKHLKEELDLMRVNILGYNYKGKSIISARNGIFSTINSPELNEFMDKLREEQFTTTKSIFCDYLNTNNDNLIKETAKDYIGKLRDEQKEDFKNKTKSTKTIEEVKDAIKSLNESNEVIDDIKRNKKITLKIKSITRSIGRFIRNLYKIFKKTSKSIWQSSSNGN